jgi:hypothetical protein
VLLSQHDSARDELLKDSVCKSKGCEVVPSQGITTLPQVEDAGNGLHIIWKVDANVLNKQSRTAYKEVRDCCGG